MRNRGISVYSNPEEFDYGDIHDDRKSLIESRSRNSLSPSRRKSKKDGWDWRFHIKIASGILGAAIGITVLVVVIVIVKN